MSLDNLAIARVCHEANRALQVELDDPAPSPHWEEAPAWQRESAIEGVAKALAGASPVELHESWCEHKVNDGWVYGEAKDDIAKTHPCLVPYDQLPPEQRLKDDLFAVIVAVLAPVRSCRLCGCTDDRACVGGCSWVSADLCSACG